VAYRRPEAASLAHRFAAEALRLRLQAEASPSKARAEIAATAREPWVVFPGAAWRRRAARLSDARLAAASVRLEPQALRAPWWRPEGPGAAYVPAERRSELPAARYARAGPPWVAAGHAAPVPEAAWDAREPQQAAAVWGVLAVRQLAGEPGAAAEPQPEAAPEDAERRQAVLDAPVRAQEPRVAA
jgi:hypothetical protein